MGLILREKCLGTRRPYKLLVAAETPVPTQVPTDFFHFKEDILGHYCIDEKSIFNQRVKSYVFILFFKINLSWDCTAHRNFFKFLEHIFRYWSMSTLILKIFFVHEILTIVQDYFRIFIILYYWQTDDMETLGTVFLRVLLSQYILFLAFNYITLRKRDDLRSPLHIIILFPFYRLLLLVFRLLSLFHNLFEYFPKFSTPDPNSESLKPPFLLSFFSSLNDIEDIASAWDELTIDQWILESKSMYSNNRSRSAPFSQVLPTYRAQSIGPPKHSVNYDDILIRNLPL
ncbi:hypothetical protein RCL1_008408 [Eukaryota sp. TZLM3-RCL]